jgi:uncharacterized protein (TIGR02217 family)
VTGFHEIRLPLAASMGAVGGPERQTEIVRLASGAESRNARWSGSRRRWDLGGTVMRLDAAHDLIAFFEARGGRLNSFRFRDPVDWKSCAPGVAIATSDQVIGTGDGVGTAFQLVKRYASGAETFARAIRKPVEGTILIAVDGEPITAFSVDVSTGVVTLEDAPAEGVVVSAGFEFDTPVRFDLDRLDIALVGHGAARVVRAPLVEVAG